jgi:hypothetical protein
MTFCGESFEATLRLPDKYFDERGIPLWHKLNARFGGQPIITWDKPIGSVPVDEWVAKDAPQQVSTHHRSSTDQFNYYREKFTELFTVNKMVAEEIQALPITVTEKIILLEKELTR